jgi:hypothetical protein
MVRGPWLFSSELGVLKEGGWIVTNKVLAPGGEVKDSELSKRVINLLR